MKLTLPEPPSANRWWRNVNGRMVKSQAARQYQEEIGWLTARYARTETGPVELRLDWYRGRKSGDLDKRLGVVLDALQGVFYENDSQIVRIVANRHEDRGNARIEVEVLPIAPEVSPGPPASASGSPDATVRSVRSARRGAS